ncbi:AI-2E family transporter, partial [Methanosalsum natronophilum]
MKFDDNLLDEGKVRMALAILSLAIIAIVIVYALIPYINAFFIAFILYVILKPVFCFLNNKLKLGKKLSGLIVLVLTVPLFIIPAYVVIQLIATDLQYAFKTIQDLVGNIPEVLDYIDFIEETRPELGLQDMLNEQVEV